MSIILCIESSTEVCSVALAKNGEIIDRIEEADGPNHARLLTGFIDRLFRANQLTAPQLDAVAVSKGPGSYTGLRIGVSAAKGICLASEIPLIAVCPLMAMATALVKNGETYAYKPLPGDLLMPMIDARRMEVYTAVFDIQGNSRSEVDAKIIDPSSFLYEMENHRCLFFGNGASKCRSTLLHPNAHFVDGVITSSANMAGLAFAMYQNSEFVDVAYFEPFYLKDFKATTPKNSILGELK
jgi:tRNA threonylcarbamoyladenosine biosynthesis protein TsaB